MINTTSGMKSNCKGKSTRSNSVEATILASIVHKESVKKRRKTKNCRSVFEPIEIRNALASRSYGDICHEKKSNDFNQVIKRVLQGLIMPHPYNTYMNIGSSRTYCNARYYSVRSGSRS
jgi:UPF0755 protein